MKQNTQIRIYRNGKLDITNEILKELKFRSKLVLQTGVEIAKYVVDDFRTV